MNAETCQSRLTLWKTQKQSSALLINSGEEISGVFGTTASNMAETRASAHPEDPPGQSDTLHRCQVRNPPLRDTPIPTCRASRTDKALWAEVPQLKNVLCIYIENKFQLTTLWSCALNSADHPSPVGPTGRCDRETWGLLLKWCPPPGCRTESLQPL